MTDSDAAPEDDTDGEAVEDAVVEAHTDHSGVALVHALGLVEGDAEADPDAVPHEVMMGELVMLALN